MKATLLALAVAALTAGMAGCAVVPAHRGGPAVHRPYYDSYPNRPYYDSYPNRNYHPRHHWRYRDRDRESRP